MFNFDLHPWEWFGGSSISFITLGLVAVWYWNRQETKAKNTVTNTDPPIKIPDVIVTIQQYLDGTTTTKATNAYGVPIAETGKHHIINTVFKNAGYEYVHTYTFEPQEDTTTLEPVEVVVGKTADEEVKKGLPYTPDQYVAKMQGKDLDELNELNEPFEPHPQVKV